MRALVLAVVVIAACGGGQTRVVQYAPPISPLPAPAPVVKVLEVDGEWKRDPLAATDEALKQEPAKVLTPDDLVSEANLSAVVKADSGQSEGRRWRFRYEPGSSYVIPTCGVEWLSVQLAPGEQTTRDPVMGDSRPWAFEKTVGGDGHGTIVEILLFRPNKSARGKHTVLVFTNIGQYKLDLQALPAGERCMSYVLFQHPERELAMLKREIEEDEEEAPVKTQRADYDDAFGCEVESGSPRWVPRRVASLHGKTYVQFDPGTVQDRDLPNLKADGAVASKFYDRHSSEYVLDGLPNVIGLQLGDKQRGYETVVCRRVAR